MSTCWSGVKLGYSPDTFGGIDLLIPAVYMHREWDLAPLDMNEFQPYGDDDEHPSPLERAVDELADLFPQDDLALQRMFMQTTAGLLEQLLAPLRLDHRIAVWLSGVD
jgi:hypothetical protein